MMTIPDDRHEDATRPEPAYRTREDEAKRMLRAGFRAPGEVPINSREESETGRCLTDQFTDQLDVREFLCPPHLTDQQVQVITLIYKHDLRIWEAAVRLNLYRAAASDLHRTALETLIRIWWDDPSFVLPTRYQRGIRLREEMLFRINGGNWDEWRCQD